MTDTPLKSTDEQALLRAICADPADDLPRLVYADWLEERATVAGEPPTGRCPNGNRLTSAHMLSDDGSRCLACGLGRVSNGFAERAEFIRVQCELVRMEESGELCEIDPREGHTCCQDPCPVCASVEKYLGLSGRERELLESHWHPWCGVPATYCGNYHDTGAFGVTFRRGFVEVISCTAAAWLAHGDSLYWHPAQTEPCPKRYGEGWHRSPPYVSQTWVCQTCSGTGRVPRPCPPTAQPVEVVRLRDTPPEFDPCYGGNVGAWGTLQRYSQADRFFITDRWPGLTFTLPDPAV